MNILFGATLAVGLTTALMLSARQEMPAAAPAAAAPVEAAAIIDHGARYRIEVPGSRKACIIARTGQTQDLTPDPGCEAIMPGLSKARFWRENADGSVAIDDAGGRTLALFAEADGAGYESFQPRLPLMSLTAER